MLLKLFLEDTSEKRDGKTLTGPGPRGFFWLPSRENRCYLMLATAEFCCFCTLSAFKFVRSMLCLFMFKGR